MSTIRRWLTGPQRVDVGVGKAKSLNSWGSAWSARSPKSAASSRHGTDAGSGRLRGRLAGGTAPEYPLLESEPSFRMDESSNFADRSGERTRSLCLRRRSSEPASGKSSGPDSPFDEESPPTRALSVSNADQLARARAIHRYLQHLEGDPQQHTRSMDDQDQSGYSSVAEESEVSGIDDCDHVRSINSGESDDENWAHLIGELHVLPKHPPPPRASRAPRARPEFKVKRERALRPEHESSSSTSLASRCCSNRDAMLKKWIDGVPFMADEATRVPTHVFRGLPLKTMLWQGPSLMANSQVDYTYSLSEPVIDSDQIDIFLSHTWSSNEYLKYVTMLYYFNGTFSFVAAHLAALSMFLMLMAVKLLTPYGGYLPVFNVPMPGNEEDFPLGLPVCGPCFFVGCAVQVGTYLFGHVFFCWIKRFYGAMIFLDKCCIHQTNDELKKEGIQHVGGFVCQSKIMFVPFDDDYFDRLWCTYEIAAFVRYKGSQVLDTLHLMPLIVATFVAGIILAGFIGTTGFMFMVAINDYLFRFWLPQGWFGWIEYFGIWGTGGTMVFGVPKFIFCHLAVQRREHLSAKLRNFSVAKANVKFKDDRNIIEKSIKNWYGTVKVFEEIVQRIFPEIVLRSLGTERQALRFRDVLQANAGVLFLFLYDATLLAYPDRNKCAKTVLMGLSCNLIIDPLFLYSLNILARFVTSLTYFSEIVKHLLRAGGVFFLGLIYPLWFAFCINFELGTLVAACAFLGMFVPLIFER